MSTKRLYFENAIERLGRILAAQYGIEVVFEGNQAMTDGKKIYLPYFDDLSEEFRADINGFLDHEVGHCRFTEFDSMAKCKTRFHKDLLNAVEDVRIEREMVKEFPGVALNLDPLNTKYRGEMEKGWASMPQAVRLIIGVRDIMEGRAPRDEEDTRKYLDLVKDEAKALNNLDTTEKLRISTENIAKLIVEAREEEKKKEKEEEKEEKKKGAGAGEGGDKGDDKKEEKDDGKDGDDKGKEKGKPDFDKMLAEGADAKKEGKSDFDGHVTDVHSLIDKEIKKEIKDTTKVKPGGRHHHSYEMSKASHIPATTQFDKVENFSGRGDAVRYGKLRRQVRPIVSGIKQTLERILKVQENAKWKQERERGRIDSRALGRLASDRSYRTPFKEFTRTETNNVAVQLFIDQSGSMYNKIETAKMAAIAIAEALKELNIPFEVTGFECQPDRKVAEFSSKLSDTKRFNRVNESLRHNIFKEFSCNSLVGIEKIYVGNQNCDGESVRWAARRLAEQKQKRKILMVFSDGMPATGDGDMSILNADLKKSVENIKKSGIEVIGIGIEAEAVKHFYPEYTVLRDAKELPKAAMSKIANILTRGRK